MSKDDGRVQLGMRAKDKITGLSGIVVAITRWLNGCVRVTLQPEKLDSGKVRDSHTFDVEQVEVITAKTEHTTETRPSGGPKPEPRRQEAPR